MNSTIDLRLYHLPAGCLRLVAVLAFLAPWVSPMHAQEVDPARFLSNRSAKKLTLPFADEPFSFAVLGDRTGGPAEGVRILAKAIDEINLLDPDLVMTVGDMIQGYGGQLEWLMQMREYRNIMEELYMPWFPVAGNHDIYWRGENPPPGEHESNYEQHFGPLWYAFEHKQCWFIVLYSDEGNPQTGEKATGSPESQCMSQNQFEWLKETLTESSGARHVFVFLHHPRWLGGGYGDDWGKVHDALVEAGNVRAVFAGHIHRMRHDGVRDGIEYVTLATTGGSQNGRSPSAGYLHHFHMVTVREDRVSLAALPVGRTMDVRAVTGEVSQAVRELDSVLPRFHPRFEMKSDGSADGVIRLRMANPLDKPTKATMTFQSDDSRWIFSPARMERMIAPKSEVECLLRVFRWRDSLDLAWRAPQCVLEWTLLDDPKHSFTLLPKTVEIPFQVDLAAPSIPGLESVLFLDGVNDSLVISDDQLPVRGDVMTLEAHVWCQRPAQKATLISNIINQQGIRLGLMEGVPMLRLHDQQGKAHEVHAQMLGPLPQGRWCHLAVQVTSGNLTFFLDGKRYDAFDWPGKAAWGTGDWTIGANSRESQPGNRFFAGKLDGIRISSVERYTRMTYPVTRRHLPDRSTHLLLNMDDMRVHWLYDESRNAAHPMIHGDAVLVGDP